MKTVMDLLRNRLQLDADFILIQNIFRRMKKLILYAFEQKTTRNVAKFNGDPYANLNDCTDLFEIFAEFFLICPIYIGRDFGATIYAEIYLEAVDFFVNIIRNLHAKKFVNASAILLNDIYTCLDVNYN